VPGSYTVKLTMTTSAGTDSVSHSYAVVAPAITDPPATNPPPTEPPATESSAPESLAP
jgi:PKD repeat protein